LKEEFKIANRAVCDIEDKIAATPAKTIEGLKVKALAALMYEGIDDPIDEMLQEGRDMLSLMVGGMRQAGRAQTDSEEFRSAPRTCRSVPGRLSVAID
jgi:hypothetical protein